MFSQDRDLVVYEPGLMRDVGWGGQRLLWVLGDISGTELTIQSGSFADSASSAGHTGLGQGE